MVGEPGSAGVAVGVARRPTVVVSGEPTPGEGGETLDDTEMVGVVAAIWAPAVDTGEPLRRGVRETVGDAGRSVEVGVAVSVGLLVGVMVGAQASAGKSTTASFRRALQSANIVRAATAILVSEPSRLVPVKMNVWVRSGYALLPWSGRAMPSMCKAPISVVRQLKMNCLGVK